jgi:hypothetical protein
MPNEAEFDPADADALHGDAGMLAEPGRRDNQRDQVQVSAAARHQAAALD